MARAAEYRRWGMYAKVALKALKPSPCHGLENQTPAA